MTNWIIAFIISMLVGLVWNALVLTVTVRDYEKAVKFRHGRVVGVLGAGRYRMLRAGTVVEVIDTRVRIETVSGQEVLTSDGISVRVTLLAEFSVAEPKLALTAVEDYTGALYARLQVALREIVAGLTIDELLTSRAAVDGGLVEQATADVAGFGVALHSARVKDIMLPGDLKATFASVVQAQKQGQAALELARGETAALRSLANAARMIADNPALGQLRTLQVIEKSYGNTFVVGSLDALGMPKQ